PALLAVPLDPVPVDLRADRDRAAVAAADVEGEAAARAWRPAASRPPRDHAGEARAVGHDVDEQLLVAHAGSVGHQAAHDVREPGVPPEDGAEVVAEEAGCRDARAVPPFGIAQQAAQVEEIGGHGVPPQVTSSTPPPPIAGPKRCPIGKVTPLKTKA